MTHSTYTLPTTQVTAYVATDGSLWIDEDECLDKNRELTNESLRVHIKENCNGDYDGKYDMYDTADYIRYHFDEIKAILGK
jgi:hypothetical protein